jgi:fructosamine-3-kinase
MDPADTRLERVLNPTGWLANSSFTVSSGERRLHAKLSRRDDWPHEGLIQTFELRATLEAKYRMPRVVAWIETDDYVGLLSEYISSRHADEGLLGELIALLDSLHRDEQFAAELVDEDEGVPSLRDAFHDEWIERFVSDLDELQEEDQVPPFVDPSLIGWMRGEIHRLSQLADIPAFRKPATSAVHRDLHYWNVLVDDSRWWVIDWDDLSLGDPAADFATLLAPLIVRGDIVGGVPSALIGTHDEGFAERFEVSCRAVVLDEVIDTLSDWADADAFGAEAHEVRRRKREAHEIGLATYRARYTDAS